MHFEERAFALDCIWMCISAARQILNTCTERFDSCCTLSSLHCSHFIIMTGDLFLHPVGWTSRTVCTSEPSHGAAARHTPQGNWCLSFSYCIIEIQTTHNYQLSILSQCFTHIMILLFFTFLWYAELCNLSPLLFQVKLVKIFLSNKIKLSSVVWGFLWLLNEIGKDFNTVTKTCHKCCHKWGWVKLAVASP